MTFAYDGDGRLVKLVKNGVTEYRFYDGAQVFLRTDGNGSTLDWTVWGPTPDEVIARQTGGAWQYYHQDPINSVVAVTNAGGSVLERYLYDPFGAPDIRDGNWNTRSSTAIDNPWLFTGQEWRGDLGLSNYKARLYQPTLGRFLQNDPVRFDAGDINLYRYCFNDPVNMTDPDGQVAFLIPVAIWAGKMALGYAADKALDYAQENLVPDEHKETVANVREAVDAARSVTGDLKTIAKHAGKLGAAVKAAVHGNSKDSMKLQHRYEIYDKTTDDVKKTGVSGGELNKDGSSKRANSQVNKENKAAGNDNLAARVSETEIPGRRAALQSEQKATTTLKEAGHSLSMQKRPK